MTRSFSLPKLNWPTLKPLPPSVSKWIKPMLFMSVGIHAAVLMTPLPEPPPKPKPKPEVSKPTVKITNLPVLNKTPKPKLNKSLLAKPLLQPKIALPPQKGLVLPAKVKKTTLATPLPKKPVQKEDSKPTPKAESQATPTATPKPVQSVEDVGSQDTSNPFSDFPHFPGAIPGCLGVPSCFTTGKPLAIVAQHFEQQLPVKKYAIQPTVSEADRKVYQVSKGGESQYLNILYDGSSSDYVLAPNPLTLADLQQAVQIPAEFTEQILAQLSGTALPDNFVNPKDFFLELGGVDEQGFDITPVSNPEIGIFKLVPDQLPQAVFDSFFAANLSQLGYQASPVASGFGGGLLYEIKKGTFKPFYLNLVPDKDGKSTVVVVWRGRPS